MHVEHHRWWSDHLGQDMALKVYGHRGQPFIVCPCSRGRYFDYEDMGAYHALNFFLKHPDVFAGTVALSGLYRLDRPEFQLTADDLPDVYFNSPITYLSGLSDPRYLERYRSGRLIVCVGQGAWEDEAIEDTRKIDHLLGAKSVPAWIDYWDHDVDHDWPWWYRQMNHFLGCLYG